METINFKEFMNGEYSAKVKKIKEVRKGKIYKITLIGGLTAIALFTGMDVTNAASGIDQHAHILYGKLLMVGKWIIIIKGAIDTINSVVQGDTASAKKNFLGYLIIYMILNGLPWAMNEVDQVFKEM